jgi:MFS transporter, SP family, xylose:H+ symportor
MDFVACTALFSAGVTDCYQPWMTFAFFAVLMVFQILFTYFIMPQTKGFSLDDLEKELVEV